MDWSDVDYLWCFYQLFGLSFWWHPFTAEDPLVNKCYISLNLMKKQTHLHLWWLEGEYIFNTLKFLGELFFHTVHCSQTECIILPSILFSRIVSKVVVCLSAFFIWLSLSTSGAPFSHFSCRHVHLWREKSQQMTVHLLSCRQGWCFLLPWKLTGESSCSAVPDTKRTKSPVVEGLCSFY